MDNLEVNEDEVRKLQRKRTSQVLESVVVPANNCSSTGSSLSSVRDQSSEVDTPGTSLAVTPAEPLIEEDHLAQRMTDSSNKTASRSKSQVSSNGKRKRGVEDEFINADARLAQALQEDEYNEPPAPASSKRGRKPCVADSDDDPLTSSPLQVSSLLVPQKSRKHMSAAKPASYPRHPFEAGSGEVSGYSQAAGALTAKKARTTLRTSLPPRSAREAATEAMNGTRVSNVVDSEDSESSDDMSNASSFESELDSEVFQVSDDSEEAEPIDALAALPDPTPRSINTASSTAAPRQRRRAPAARTPNTYRHRRRFGVEDRVHKKAL